MAGWFGVSVPNSKKPVATNMPICSLPTVLGLTGHHTLTHNNASSHSSTAFPSSVQTFYYSFKYIYIYIYIYIINITNEWDHYIRHYFFTKIPFISHGSMTLNIVNLIDVIFLWCATTALTRASCSFASSITNEAQCIRSDPPVIQSSVHRPSKWTAVGSWLLQHY